MADIDICTLAYINTDVSDGDIKPRSTWILKEIAKFKKMQLEISLATVVYVANLTNLLNPSKHLATSGISTNHLMGLYV